MRHDPKLAASHTRIARLVIALFALLWLNGAPLAEAVTGTVDGTIANLIGRPLADIEVSFVEAPSGDIVDFVMTDGAGAFAFENVTPGPFLLFFQDWSETYTYECYAGAVVPGIDAVRRHPLSRSNLGPGC